MSRARVQSTGCVLTRDAGPKPHIVWFKPRGFLGFAEKSPRGPYIVGQGDVCSMFNVHVIL